MPNLQSVLKAEISRVARKELKGDTSSKKSSATYRSDIAALKRRLAALEALVKKLSRGVGKVTASAGPVATSEKVRFSAKGFASQRQRLGLSAQALGQLIGASGLSVYKWEKGEGRPRPSYLPAIATLRSMGKKQASAKLAALQA